MCNTCNGKKIIIDETSFMAGYNPCPECNHTGRKQSLKPIIEQLNQMLVESRTMK